MQRYRPSYHKAYSHNTPLFQAFNLQDFKNLSNIGKCKEPQLFKLKQGVTSEFPGFVPHALVGCSNNDQPCRKLLHSQTSDNNAISSHKGTTDSFTLLNVE